MQNREVFVHWEADLAVGSKIGDYVVPLVLAERKNRNYLVMRVKDKTSESVMQEFEQLRSYCGVTFGLVSKQLSPTKDPNSPA